MANVAVTFGYVDPDGTNDAVLISPAPGSTQSSVVSAVVTALHQTGVTPTWVDGSPTWLVNGLASHMGIPSGTPVGWYPTATPDADVEEAIAPSEPMTQFVFNRAMRRAMARGKS